MPWPQTGATHYHAQLELLAIKGLVVCRLCSMAMIYDSCCSQDGYQAQVAHHRYNTIQLQVLCTFKKDI